MVNTSYSVVFQYKNDVLKFSQHAEGYVSATYGFGDYFYNYVFNYTDHLGNTHLFYTENNMEDNHYYPFGLKHKACNAQEYINNT